VLNNPLGHSFFLSHGLVGNSVMNIRIRRFDGGFGRSFCLVARHYPCRQLDASLGQTSGLEINGYLPAEF